MSVQPDQLPECDVGRRFPMWVRVGVSAFVAVLIPVYWHHYGPSNFLWFSDIALFGAVVALWTQSRLLASMMLLAAALPDTVWNIDFLIALISGKSPFGVTEYMLNAALPLHLRLVSLFHVFLPPLLVWMVWKLGYDRRALIAQTLLAWVVLLATFLVTDPARNINWVFRFGSLPQETVAPWLYFIFVLALLPIAIYLPIHWICRRVFAGTPSLRNGIE